MERTVSMVAGENRFTAYKFNLDNVNGVDSVLYVTGSQALKRKDTLYLVSIGINFGSDDRPETGAPKRLGATPMRFLPARNGGTAFDRRKDERAA